MAGGAILTSLFHKFPREQLFCVHAEAIEGTTDYRQHRLQARALRPRLVPLLRLLWQVSRQLLQAPLLFSNREWKLLLIQACQFRLPRRVDEEIRRFAPDVIYAWTGDAVWLRLLEDCVQRYRVPYVIHFMDNQVELRGETAVQRAVYKEFQRNVPKAIEGASRMFTISAAMGLAYQNKFGKPFEVFHNLMDATCWPWPAPASPSDVFSIVFTGSIESGQVNGLRDVAAAVERLSEHGHRIRLVLYVSEAYERRVRSSFDMFPHVQFVRHPELSALRAALTNADLLVLAYGFDQACVEYYRYSFATKTVPYMLSGRCILAYGPPGIEPIGYLLRGGWAYVVGQEGAEALESAITRLMNAPEERNGFARAAHPAACTEHDLEINSSRFFASMREVAAAGPMRPRRNPCSSAPREQ